MKHFKVTEPYLRINTSLGEGAYWEEATNTLRFVDIVKREVHTIDLDIGPSSHRVLAKTDFPVTVTAEVAGHKDMMVIGTRDFIGLMNKNTGTYEPLKHLWSDKEKAQGKSSHFRFNDGAVDPQGRFWIGTMVDPSNTPGFPMEGTLYRLDADLSLHVILHPLAVPNGLSWTADGKHMYVTDSLTGITRYAFDAATGTISHPEIFLLRTDLPEGAPDGHVMDEDEHLWIAVYGGGRVVRMNPRGEIVAEVLVPAKNVTCPVLVGTRLFVTTAADESTKSGSGENSGASGDENLAGSVFAVDVGVKGQPRNMFKMK